MTTIKAKKQVKYFVHLRNERLFLKIFGNNDLVVPGLSLF